MAAIDFPSAPATNDEFTADGRTWVYDGTVWNAKGVASDPFPPQSSNGGELLVTNGTDASWSNTVQANSASVPAIIAKGVTLQSGNIQEWQTSTGTVTTAISASGFIDTGYADIDVIRITSPGTSTIPAVIKGTSGQTGNLQEWQNSSSTVLASISSAGLLSAKPAAGVAATSASTAGYIGMPQNPEDTVGVTLTYTLTASDAGKHIYLFGTPGGAPTITIPANSATAFEIGTTIVIINDMGSATNASIAITTDTLVLAGTGSTGTRTLARYGMATLVKVTATRWIISGNGLS